MTARVLLCVENERKSVEYREALRVARLPEERLRVLIPRTNGADPERLAAERSRLAASAAGLVLAGGPDIHPRHFGEEPLEGATLRINEALDALELDLLAGAQAGRTPVLAICKGMQTANVYLGGDLYQDLPIQFPGVGEHAFRGALDHPAHRLERIDAQSPFGESLARHDDGVNSRHHQAVRKPAPGLREVAWAPDGVLEAFEWAGDEWWLKGVQWHPENLTAMPYQLELWRLFLRQSEALEA